MKAKIHFRELIQDSQDLGGDDEHMVSEVLFDLEIAGHTKPGLSCMVKQTVGGSFESEPLEVSRPREADSLDLEEFRNAVEDYFRGLVGSSGRVLRVGPDASSLRMRNNRFVSSKTVEISVIKNQGSTW